jgi:hypothetical protein
MEYLDAIVRWIIAPVAAFVWFLHGQVQEHKTDIAVLKSRVNSDKEAHDREMKEIRETTNKIFAKLDSIEEALRK